MKKIYLLKYLLPFAILGCLNISLRAQNISVTHNGTIENGSINNLVDGDVSTAVKIKAPTGENLKITVDFNGDNVFNSYSLAMANYQQFAPLWGDIADKGHLGLDGIYWNVTGNYYNQALRADGTPHEGFNYWWHAHILDILIDAYIRTGDNAYKTKISTLCNGIYAKNGNKWAISFYDDMEWMGLSLLRAYEATGVTEYKDIAKYLWGVIKNGWTDDVKNGGIMWETGSPNSKNACSNGPAMILGARIYAMDGDTEDLAFTKKIYDWMAEYLVDERGVVWDAYGNFNESNVYTYNIGTWIGGCLELWRITGESKYKDAALKSATYTVSDTKRLSVDGILRSLDRGDGGLFGIIFMRYLSQLILHGDLDASTKKMYTDYFERNSLSVLGRGSMIFNSHLMFGRSWRSQPTADDLSSSTQTAGVMLFELMDELEREGIYTNTTRVDVGSFKLSVSEDGSVFNLLEQKDNVCFVGNGIYNVYESSMSPAKKVELEILNSANEEYTFAEFATDLEIELPNWDVTDNGGELTASHPGEAGYEVANVIDNKISKYVVKNVTGDVWIQYVSTVPVSPAGFFFLASPGNIANAPKSWKIEGSNNGTSWSLIDTKSNQAFAGPGTIISYENAWNYNNVYTHFRLTITELNGGTDLELADWQIIAPVKVFNPDPDYDFTSNGGILSAEKEGNSGETYINATDNQLGKKYCITGATSTWIQYQSPIPMIMSGYAITGCPTNPERHPKNWEMLGSNDGENWVVLDTQENQKWWLRFATQKYSVDTNKAYTYFRLNITAHNGGDQLQFAEMEFYGVEGCINCDGTGIKELLVDDVVWEDVKTPYVLACDDTRTSVTVKVTPEDEAIIEGDDTFIVDVSKPSVKDVKFKIKSATGTSEQEYTFKIERPIPFNQIVMQKWNNTLFVNNNPKTNGGYTFTAYTWNKDGTQISSKQSYSAGNNKTDILDANASYYVQVTTDKGDVLKTCNASPVLKSMNVKIYPNPVSVGETVYLEADIDQELLDNANIRIYNINGNQVKSTASVGRVTPLNMPGSTGTYIVKMMSVDGFEREFKVIVK